MRVNSIAFKHELSHEWERTQHVREYRAGHLGRG